MNNVKQFHADLLAAARYLIEDGASLDGDEAYRIGLSLAELAGIVRAENCVHPDKASIPEE